MRGACCVLRAACCVLRVACAMNAQAVLYGCCGNDVMCMCIVNYENRRREVRGVPQHRGRKRGTQ